jgi:hypothetical protein
MDNNNISGFRYINPESPRDLTWAQAQVKVVVLDEITAPITESALDLVTNALLQARGLQYVYLAPYALGLRSN